MTRQRTGPSMTALVAFVLLAAGISAAGPAGAAGGGVRPGVAVRLAGAPSLPRGASIVGPTNRAETITADVSLEPRDPAALHAFVAAVSSPGSPRFHHYLGPGQFGSTFGPTTNAIDSVRTWLSSAGLHLGRTTPDGLLVPVTGTADQMAGTFGVSLVDTRLPGGRIARFSENAPSVPSSVAPLVQGVVGLSTVGQPQPQIVPRPISPAPPVPAPAAVPHAGPTPCSQATQTGGYTADQLAATYGLSSLYGLGRTGAGQAIGLYELEPYFASDVAAYQACYGLTNSIVPVPVDGGASGHQQGEAALDIEDAAGLAPGAVIKVYSGPSGGTGPIDTYSAMVNDLSLKVISTSWGLCEPEMAAQPGQQTAESFLFSEAAADGQTVVAASGDSGSTDCYAPGNNDFNSSVTVDDPADQPDVTGVGGTSLLHPGSPPAETVWNNFTGSGGGGVSSDFGLPAWQVGPGVNSPLAASRCAAAGRSSCRQVPDVSASSDPLHGYAVIFHGSWQVIGGTSGAAPLVGAMTAVLDQGLGTPAGMMNPALYGAGSCSASPFSDVTSGSNALLPASNGLYPATANYDLASGWGSPSALELAFDLALRPVCPVVTGIRPNKGVTGGGNSILVTGFNFAGVTSVRFGPFAASFAVTSPGSLTVQVPAGPAGGSVVDVTVSNAGGSSRQIAADRYIYALPGYWLTASDGGIFTYGDAGFLGSTGAIRLNQPIVGMASTPDDRGYWLVASDGGIFTFGDAGFLGSTGAIRLNRPIVGMAATPDGGGYWLVASDGGIFTFGDAGFFGSTGAIRLNQPIVGMAATPDGGGYWLVASDGGIFTFGDAGFHGSAGAIRLNRPIVGMAATRDGSGYWLVASDGGIFTYGDAGFHGSAGAIRLNQPIVGMAASLSGNGYWLVASDGGIFTYGDASFYGSAGAIRLNRPVVGMAAT